MPARLLVGGRGEQDVAAEAGDRVARRIEAGGARLGREQAHDPELHRDHGLHVDRAAAVDVAVVEVGRERIVTPALGRRRHDIEMRQQEQRLAAGAVAAQPGVDGAASRRPARRSRVRGRPPRAASRGARAMRVSPSGASGAGGLIDGIRIRSRSSRDQLVDGGRPGRIGQMPRRCRRPEGHGAAPNTSARAMPITNPPNIDRQDHPQQQLAVVALLAQAGLGSGSRPPAMYGAARPLARAIWARGESYSSGSGGNAVGGRSASCCRFVAHRSIMPPTSGPRRTRCRARAGSRAGH